MSITREVRSNGTDPSRIFCVLRALPMIKIWASFIRVQLCCRKQSASQRKTEQAVQEAFESTGKRPKAIETFYRARLSVKVTRSLKHLENLNKNHDLFRYWNGTITPPIPFNTRYTWGSASMTDHQTLKRLLATRTLSTTSMTCLLISIPFINFFRSTNNKLFSILESLLCNC
jgi:hypothetical protein